MKLIKKNICIVLLLFLFIGCSNNIGSSNQNITTETVNTGEIQNTNITTEVFNAKENKYASTDFSEIDEIKFSTENQKNFDELTQYTKLKKLTIFGGEKSTITSLDGIEKLQTLTYLDIIDQNIHNISSVKSLNNLTWLGLTKLNDSDLVGNCSVDSPIYSLDKLEQLFVSSSISDDTIKQLKVHLPNCEIIRVA